ncbi:MAG: hypothetical protein AAGA69_07135 [Pseudomonadota bacterium]
MSNEAARMRALQNKARQDAQQGRSPANVSHLGSAERTAYTRTYNDHKRK